MHALGGGAQQRGREKSSKGNYGRLFALQWESSLMQDAKILHWSQNSMRMQKKATTELSDAVRTGMSTCNFF